MKYMKLHEIRNEYLNFFKEKEHLIVPSFSLVPPKNDKSLLLINAGMAPLKPYFTGVQKPPKRRMATCQKCLRTGDIENVGQTARHATFFEMLGNFSFGDYFKREAIKWAWEFITERMEIPKEKLWVSIYEDDDEAFDIWNKEIGIHSDRIIRLGKEDNFWELEVGPCGPCSEIYVDRGEKYGCGKPDCKPGCDCDRYVEIWNLVFSQYDKDQEGNYKPLPNPNIDTGMGLERITAIMQNVDNIFEIDIIRNILKEIEKISKVNYGDNKKSDISLRVITDHIRAATFMVSDGILPSNEGRGYVLRRLIRRASRHGKLLGIKDIFLGQLSSTVVDLWGDVYPRLKEKKVEIKKIIEIEERKFQETVEQGMSILNDMVNTIKSQRKDILNGEFAFKLYDTYGFPLDLTKEILSEHNIKVDEEGFNKEMEIQRNRARKAREEENNLGWQTDENVQLKENIFSIFEGYNKLSINSKVLALVKDDKSVNVLKEKDKGMVILEKTTFYPEGGGQIGDVGIIKGEGCLARVLETKKGPRNIIFHLVEIEKGQLNVDMSVEGIVDKKRRMDAARNHTATHLLHKVLKETLGEHVNQAGSLVTNERLRFDFTHFESIDKEQLNEIEKIVNLKILEGLDVSVVETTLEDALNSDVTALFDEKYGDRVRIVNIGNYSKELCGGTHVKNSSEIGLFKIISETGIASGVRRIEAVTGLGAYIDIKNMEKTIEDIVNITKGSKVDIVNRVRGLAEDNKIKDREIERLKSEIASLKTKDVLNDIIKIDDINVIVKRIDGMDADSLRQMGDTLKDKLKSVVVVLGTVNEGKIIFISMATKDLVKRGIHAGNLIREVAKITGGGGGGRPDMAQAGGKEKNKIDVALESVIDIIKKQIK